MVLGQIPTVEGVPNNGLCDLRRQDCIRTRVQGSNFIDNEQLSCQMVESKVGIFFFFFCWGFAIEQIIEKINLHYVAEMVSRKNQRNLLFNAMQT